MIEIIETKKLLANDKVIKYNVHNLFTWYKNSKKNGDIASTYFNKKQFDKSLKIHPIIEQLESGISIMPYSSLPYEKINPYINNFFSLTETISNIIKTMEIKYNINYENTCCVFYRGLDKCVETELPSYDVILNKALKVTENEKNKIYITNR